MRYSLFWDIARRRFVVIYGRFGTICSIFKGETLRQSSSKEDPFSRLLHPDGRQNFCPLDILCPVFDHNILLIRKSVS